MLTVIVKKRTFSLDPASKNIAGLVFGLAAEALSV
jgi:hypothetical protein